jgi:plasmid stabilization system protein ParE
MVTGGVKWMPRALTEYKQTLHYYNQRNGSTEYSDKIHSAVKRRLATLQKFPEIGHRCAKEKIRIVNVAGFGIFYELEDEQILIHSFWDYRRNPDDRVDKI